MRRIVRPRFDSGAALCLVLPVLCAGCSPAGSPARDTPAAKYDAVSGRLKELAFDSSQDGRNDAVAFLDGARLQRIEVDEDEDGKVDRWEFYDEKRRLRRAGYSRQHNGVLDAMAFYGDAGDVERVEMSTHGDGRFNRIEFYRSGSLARVEEDTNGDGRVDKWEVYAVRPDAAAGESSWIETASFDESFRGTPSRRLVYRPDGSVLRIEVDPDGDGVFTESPVARREPNE